MSILEFASDDTTNLPLGEEADGDYLVVRTDLSKKDFNKLLKQLPEGFDSDKGFTPGQADDFTATLFDMLVTGWSLSEPAKVENYLKLKRGAAAVVDAKLLDHFNALSPSEEERSKSKGNRK